MLDHLYVFFWFLAAYWVLTTTALIECSYGFILLPYDLFQEAAVANFILMTLCISRIIQPHLFQFALFSLLLYLIVPRVGAFGPLSLHVPIGCAPYPQLLPLRIRLSLEAECLFPAETCVEVAIIYFPRGGVHNYLTNVQRTTLLGRARQRQLRESFLDKVFTF